MEAQNKGWQQGCACQDMSADGITLHSSSPAHPTTLHLISCLRVCLPVEPARRETGPDRHVHKGHRSPELHINSREFRAAGLVLSSCMSMAEAMWTSSDTDAEHLKGTTQPLIPHTKLLPCYLCSPLEHSTSPISTFPMSETSFQTRLAEGITSVIKRICRTAR